MSYYKINYEQLRQQPEISKMLSALERGLQKFDIDFYLVGAVARDVWMRAIHSITPRRTTGDIDFAVLINNKESYEALKTYLVETEGFNASKENAFVLLWKDRTEVDLMPFGAIADEDGEVRVSGTGYTTLKVPGFKEVYEEGLPELDLQEEHQFKFCTLPGIVILKLIAWDDRPEVRKSDITDISDILKHYFDMHDDVIFEYHNDLFEGEESDLNHIAARVMGREMYKIAKRNAKLFTRLQNIIDTNTQNPLTSEIGAIMTGYFQNTVEDNITLLKHLRQGLTESIINTPQSAF